MNYNDALALFLIVAATFVGSRYKWNLSDKKVLYVGIAIWFGTLIFTFAAIPIFLSLPYVMRSMIRGIVFSGDMIGKVLAITWFIAWLRKKYAEKHPKEKDGIAVNDKM